MSRALVLVAAVMLSWLGFFVHNLAAAPALTFLRPETLWPTLVYAVLLALWFVRSARTVARWLLLVWAVLHLAGGALSSVLPLPLLPFSPEPDTEHLLVHLLYAVLQLPLIVLLVLGLLNRPRPRT